MKKRMRPQVTDIVDAAGGKVVEDKDLIATSHVSIRQMRTNKTRPTRDQDAHESESPV
jgi:hypothetical protein